jgi:hypothetical protein
MTQPAASPPGGGRRRPAGLGERDRAILDFERDWRVHEGGKGAAVRERFGITPARYYQLLARLLDDPAAAAHDPLVIARLRRRRDERRRRRAASVFFGPRGR